MFKYIYYTLDICIPNELNYMVNNIKNIENIENKSIKYKQWIKPELISRSKIYFSNLHDLRTDEERRKPDIFSPSVEESREKLAKAVDKGQVTIRKPPVQLEESSFVTPSTSPQKKTILTPAGKQELNKRLKENPRADRKYAKTQLKMQSEQDPQKYGHLVMKKRRGIYTRIEE